MASRWLHQNKWGNVLWWLTVLMSQVCTEFNVVQYHSVVIVSSLFVMSRTLLFTQSWDLNAGTYTKVVWVIQISVLALVIAWDFLSQTETFLKWLKKIKLFRSVWKYRLKNTVMVSFNKAVRQMTEMFEWPKYLSENWPKCFSEKKQVIGNDEKCKTLVTAQPSLLIKLQKQIPWFWPLWKL